MIYFGKDNMDQEFHEKQKNNYTPHSAKGQKPIQIKPKTIS